MIQAILDVVACFLWIVVAIVVCLSLWYGIKIEIGKAGEGAHITLELYAAKRLFK